MENKNECYFPQHEKEKCNIAFSTIHPYSPKQTAYGDLTGKFPYKSLMVNRYIYVMYDYNSNAILVQAIPNRQAQTIENAWEKLTQRLNMNGQK